MTPLLRYLRALLLVLVGLIAPLHGAVNEARAGDIPDGHAHLLVIADFDTVEIEINGTSYPWEWIWGGSDGVFLPADRSYTIIVSTSPESRRTFRFRLREGERRILVVDITNQGQSGPPTGARGTLRTGPTLARTEDPAEEENQETIGYLGVSSSPRGTVLVDGRDTGVRTPARRIELEPGRHEVQIRWDDSQDLSEVKYVLIRTGVNTNVFFRQPRAGGSEE
jgi:hypothetical protein